MTIDEVFECYEETGCVDYEGTHNNTTLRGTINNLHGVEEFSSSDCQQYGIDVEDVEWYTF